MTRWLVVLVCALGCGGATRARPAGTVHLAGVQIDGNRAISDGVLLPQLALRRAVGEGRPIDPYQLTQDTGRIRSAYLNRGFFNVKVAARVVDERGRQTAVFTVVEGRRGTMDVVIKGLPPEVPEARARALVAVRDGGPFDYEAYAAARPALQTLVESAGYAHAQLDAYVTVERSKDRAVAIYEITAGPRCTFGATTIAGASGPLAGAIEHRVAVRAGAVYSPAALAETQRALYELGRFSAVVVEPQRDGGAEQTVIPVKITVVLASRHELRFGGGFGREPLTYEARARAGGSYIPLADPLWTFSAEARVAATVEHDFNDPQPKVRALATAQRMDLLRPRMSGELGVGYDFTTVEAYTSTGPLVRLGLSSPIGVRWLTASLGWALSYAWFTEIDPVLDAGARASLRLDEPQRLGMYQATLTADLRDNPLEPRRGVYASMRVHQGTRAAGGALAFTQLTPDLRGYHTLFTPRFVLAVRARVGAIFGEVPVTERYFSGGAQSNRGFSERTLAPTLVARLPGEDEDRSVVIGGAGLVETSAELRIGLGTLWSLPVGATLFLDGGDVTNDPYDLDLFDLHWAAGAGLSLRVAGIKLRLDVGHRLNRKGPDEPRYTENTAVHFGVGDTF